MHAVSECTFPDPRVYVSVFAPLCMLSCPSSVHVFEQVKRTEVIIICSMKLINKQARGTWPHFSCSSSTKDRGEGGAGRRGGGEEGHWGRRKSVGVERERVSERLRETETERLRQ